MRWSDGATDGTVLAPTPRDPVTPVALPTVSVIIAAFEAAEFIGDAVRSVLEQTLRPIEIIVCDDASTDDLVGALAPYRAELHLLRRATNGGEAAAKNDAARAARGEYVAVLDADDVYLPNRLNAVAALAARRPDLDILDTDAYVVGPEGNVLHKFHDGNPFPVEDQRGEILRRNFLFGHAVVRRRALLEAGGYDPAIRHTADWDLWIRMILAGSMAGLVAEPLAQYRLHASSLSTERLSMSEGRLATLGKTCTDPRVTDREQATLRERIAAEERRYQREAMEVSLAAGRPDRRSRARVVLQDPGQARRTRVKALGAVVAPCVAGLLLRRREASVWRSVGDRTFSRTVGSGAVVINGE
jgi:hypothetical protein